MLAQLLRPHAAAAAPQTAPAADAPTAIRPPESSGVMPRGDLDQRDADELLRHEKLLAGHKMSWVQGARALAEIHRRELYRAKWPSFETYLDKRWGMSRRHGLDLVTVAAVADNLQGVRHALSMRAALRLAKLPAAEQSACLEDVIARTGSRGPTAGEIAAAVDARLPKKKTNTPQASKKKRGPKTFRMRVSGGALTIQAKSAETDLRALLLEALAELERRASSAAA